MKQRLRKSLSMILSIMMIVTSISVAFSMNASAAAIDDYLTALQAIPVAERDWFSVTTHTDAALGNITHSIVDKTTNGTIYDAAVKFAVWAKANAKTYPDDTTGPGTDGAAYSWWTRLSEKMLTTSGAPYTTINGNAAFQRLTRLFADNLQPNTTSQGVSSTVRAKPFRAYYRNTGSSGNNNDISDTTIITAKTNVTVTVERSEIQILRKSASTGVFPANVNTKLTYGATGGRGEYKASGCSNTGAYNFFVSFSNPAEVNSRTVRDFMVSYRNYFYETVTELSDPAYGKIRTNYPQFNPFDLTLAEINTLVTNNAYYVDTLATYSGTAMTTITQADKDKFFPNITTVVNPFIELCLAAQAVALYKVNVDYFQVSGGFNDTVLNNTAYDPLDYDAMTVLYAEQQTHYSILNGLSAAIKARLVTYLSLDMTRIEAARAELIRDMKLYELRVYQQRLAELYGTFYEDDYLNYHDLSDQTLNDVYTELSSILFNIQDTSKYPTALFTDVFGGPYSVLAPYNAFKAQLEYEYNTYRPNITISTGLKTYFNDILSDDLTLKNSEDLIKKLDESKVKYTDFTNASNAALPPVLTQHDHDVLYSGYNTLFALPAIAKIENTLESRFTAQVNTAYEYYKFTIGAVLTWDNFTVVKTLITLIDKEIFEYYKTDLSRISATTRARYDELLNIALPAYEQFLKDQGYSKFVQLQLNPKFPTRQNSIFEDMARTEGDLFNVTDSALLNIVKRLDTILTSDDFKALTGMDIQACIKALPTECFCSDAMVNCVIMMLYPEVTKALENTWSELPGMDGNKYLFDGGEANVSAKTLHQTLADTSGNTLNNLAIYPDLLAPLVQTTFPGVATRLRQAVPLGGDYRVFKLKDAQGEWIDDEHGSKSATKIWDSITTDGKLDLVWGIDAATDPAVKSELFRVAMSSALEGVLPLLKSLLMGQSYAGKNNNVATLSGVKYSGISPTNITPLWLDLTINPGTEGYAKVLTPIFEVLLGSANIPDSVLPTPAQLKAFTTPRQLVDAIVNPIDTFINTLAAAPVDKLLEMLPTMAYAISYNQIAPLLNELSANVVYTPDATVTVAYIITSKLSCLGLDLSGEYYLNVGDLLFGDPEKAPIDFGMLTDLNSLIQQLPSCLASDDCTTQLTLPTINAGCLMRLGKLRASNDGQSPTLQTKRVAGSGDPTGNYCSAVRHYIQSDKADIVYAIIDYILTGINQDPNLLPSLMGMLGMDMEEVSPELLEILGNMSSGTTIAGTSTTARQQSIAAIVELFNQKEYPVAQYNWIAPPTNSAPYRYLGYNNMWTAQKADNLAGNLDNLVASVLTMTGETQTIQEIVDEALNGFLNADTLKSLTDTLGELELDEMLANLLKNSFGVDIADWLIYKNTDDLNADGIVDDADQELFFYYKPEDIVTRDDFLAAVYEILAPVVPVLTFILDGKDLRIFVKDAAEGLYLYGNDGYAKAIIPILQLLGVPAADILDPAAYTAAIASDPSNALKAIIDPIFGIIDEIAANPVSTILAKLPNIIYFLSSNGLATTLNIVLHPILVLLDTVRPIYPLDVQTIIGMLAGEEPTTPPDPDEEPGFDFSLIDATRIDQFTFQYIIGIVDQLTEMDLSLLKDLIPAHIAEYATPFTFLNNDQGYMVTELDNGDVFTIIVSLLLEMLKNPTNQEKIAEMAKLDGAIIPAIFEVLKEKTIGIETIDWFYYTETPVDQAGYEYFLQNPADAPQPASNHSLVYLTYPNNWTEGVANYIENNFDAIIADVIEAVKPGSSIAAILADAFTLDQLYNDDLFNDVLEAIQDLLKDISVDILDVAGIALDIDLSFWKEHDGVWNVTDRASFIAALTDVLATIEPLINWLLCGEDLRYFTPSTPLINPDTGEDVLDDLLVLSGTKGYAYSLVPILEALGITMDDGLLSADAFASAGFDVKVSSLFNAIFDRVEEILADPVNEALAMIPNLIYFINADGLTVSVKNLLAPVYAIIDAVNPALSEPIDVASLIPFPIDDLSFASILDFASTAINLGTDDAPINLNFDIFKNFLADFWLGGLSSFASASGDNAFRMDYILDEATHEHRGDLITIIVSLALQFVDAPANRDALISVLGDDGETIYTILKNILHMDSAFPVTYRPINWILTDKAGTGEALTPLLSTQIFGAPYGALWTREKAKFIADHLDEFINNLIHLLGIEIEGMKVEDLSDVLDTFIGVSLYTSDNVNAIITAIKGLVAQLNDIPGATHIKALIKESLGVDLDAWNSMTDTTFTIADGDRAAFVNALCEILAPINPVLEWILSGKDISFFVDENAQDYILLQGAQGYAYGIIPILEALGCKDVMTASAFNADPDNMLKNVLNTVLDQVDIILADPVNELFGVLPGIIYFINSDGLSSSLLNLLQPVLVLFDAVQPLIGKNLNDIVGIDIENLKFDTIMDLLVEMLNDSTGAAFIPIIMNDIAELTMGRVEKFTTANDLLANRDAYTMVYDSEAQKTDMVTILLRIAMKFLNLEQNHAEVKKLADENLDGDAYKAVVVLIDAFFHYASTPNGMDAILGSLYYVAFGAIVAVDEVTWVYDNLTDNWKFIFDTLDSLNSKPMQELNKLIKDLFAKLFPEGSVIDPAGPAKNGLIKFFEKIIEFFQKIIDFFKNLFN